MSAFREYWLVLRLHIRMQFGLSALSSRVRRRASGKDALKMLGFGLLMLYAVGAVLFLYGAILFPLMRASVPSASNGFADLTPMIMSGVVILSMAVVLVFGTMTILALVFGAKDAETFAALPLRGQSVFLSKFTMAYAIESGMTALFLWPAVVIYGIVLELPVSSFLPLILRTIPVWLLLPAVPMALAALLSMLFTRLTALVKHRDKLLMVFSVIMVLGLVAGQSLLTGRLTVTLSDPAKVAALLADGMEWLSAVTDAFPPAGWSAQTLIGSSAGPAVFGFLGLAAAGGVGLLICVVLSRRLYYKGVLAQLEAPKGTKKGFRQTGVKEGSALRAFTVKELRLIVRTPVYALNVLMGLFVPVLMVIVGMMGSSGASAGIETIRGLLGAIAGESGDLLYLISAGIVMFTAIMGSTGVATSYSREGAMLWIAQTVPVPVKTQVAARLLSGYLLVFAGSLLTLLATVFLLGFTVPQLIFGMVAGSCAAFPLLAAALIPDAIRPKRRWNSEAEAMKQNVNSILAMLLCMGLAVAIGLLALFLQSLMPGWAAGCCVALVCFALGALLFSYAVRLSEKMMKTVDG